MSPPSGHSENNGLVRLSIRLCLVISTSHLFFNLVIITHHYVAHSLDYNFTSTWSSSSIISVVAHFLNFTLIVICNSTCLPSLDFNLVTIRIPPFFPTTTTLTTTHDAHSQLQLCSFTSRLRTAAAGAACAS